MDWYQHELLLLWGKTGDKEQPEIYHPALFHMLDVAMVAKMLLSERASPRYRLVLARSLGMSVSDLQTSLPWLIALHDVGKISPAFQGIAQEQKNRLLLEQIPLGDYPWENKLPHSQISEVFIESYFKDSPDKFRRSLRDMASGHHGFFPPPGTLAGTRQLLRRYEPPDWELARTTCASLLAQSLGIVTPRPWAEPNNVSVASMTLTGFTILCDWLGSDHTIFKPTPGTTLEDYLAVSAERATHAVDKAGFFQESISQAPTQFAQLFAGKIQPRPLQAAIDRIPSEVIRNPCLTVIEAPTGEGKTEAALALAHRIAREIGSDELYYALPTTATSNQMFGRLQKFLIENLGLSSQVKLVHGQAFLFEDDLQIRPLSNGAADGKPGAAEWFAPKKRSLLAPFGVGTIDQAELAALNVRHVPLRMIGLAGKVIIVDEVHAYDIYMTTIIERLLEWLAALGTSVILLSATLPKERRARLARAFSGVVSQGTGPDAYPSIWIVDTNGNTYASEPQAAQSNRKIFLYPNVLHYSDEEAQEKAEWLINSVADGGCVCWMTNTVKRAQQMFDALDRLAPDDFERTLIHAQFPLETRQILEQEITKKYGPDTSCRPAIGVVIGTQVLEQSLDLDFDLLVSDIAPMDLLLQRAGRLHRHKHPRPVSNSLPRFWLNSETGSSGLSISVDQYVYSEYILRLTWDQLKDRQEINLPDDYRALIESVYGGAMAESDELLTAAWKKLQREESQATAAAQLALLPAPQAEDSFSGPAAHLEFIESDNQSSWIVARTRLGEESLTIIPIERDGNSIGVVLDGSILTIPLEGALSRENQLKLLRRSIRVSNRRLVEILKNQEQENLPLEISGAPLLKDVYWLWLSEGRAIFRDHTGIIKVEIDSRLGLVIQTEKGA